MGLFDCFKKKTVVVPDEFVLRQAHDFKVLCEKLDKLGKPMGGTRIEKGSSPNGITKFYAQRSFHDIDWLEFAHNSWKKGDLMMVKHYYDELVEKLQFDDNENRFFFSMFSDFCDFLSGEEEFYKFIREGSSSYYSIRVSLGSCLPEETYVTESALYTFF